MLKSYLKITIRNLNRNKVYSFINIFSLAIGMAACLVIYLFISNELSFDAFHSKKDNIYRLDEVQSFPGTNTQKVALSMPGMGPNLASEFPEVKSYARFWGHGGRLYSYGDKEIMVDKTAMVDSTFLKIFDFELLHGDRNTMLDLPNSIVLTEELSMAFFNTVDAIDKELVYMDGDTPVNLKITGVLKNVPDNSHLQFDMLASMSTITSQNPEFNNRWGSNFLVTYLLLENNTDIPALESKFPDFMVSHMNEDINDYYKLYLQALEDVHLGSVDMDHDYHNWREFDGSYVKVFFIMAIFVLIIASVNFMNLSTARSTARSKEVGLRKSIGANKSQIINQFLGESVILTFIALILALIIAGLFIPYLNEMAGRNLTLLSLTTNSLVPLFIVMISLIIGILSGSYPAFFIASFQPGAVLKGRIQGLGKKSVLRNVLVVGQFAVAIALIIGTIFAIRQLHFMQNKDIGFDKDQIVLVPLSRGANDKFETMKTELLRKQGVKGVTAAGQRIGNNFHQWGFKVKTDTAVNDITVSNVNVEYDYLSVYDIELKDGRAFSKEHGADAGYSFIINETLERELDLTDNAIGKTVGHGWYHNDTLGTIIGVAKDFNFNSLHHKINTLVISLHPEWGYDEMSVKVSPENMSETIEEIRATWTTLVDDRPFEYHFLDQHFETLYASDKQMSKVATMIAILAIIIACLGLFGLASITTEQRIKEIGVRKVLGASVIQLFSVLSRNFIILVLIAFVIAVPVTIYFIRSWLENFAYKTNISFEVFLFAGGLSMVVALVTISFKIIRTARLNPVDSLKEE
ncbi:ABC transporter permease [Fulvivirgaceae bacterium BMA10]|uniref:ABC transporter permease n=1 Tax=Splendidivirga corallicola TaxID=3051826 RepID=A0ABT8KI98_9BACT|nr:ABC transporter permease [Fulvivirgaceae bacterium BMA10]